MASFDVHVEIRPRAGIADPEGATIERSLPALGFDGVADVIMGRSIRFRLDADSDTTARAEVDAMCERFLANPVIEDYQVVVSPR